MFTGIIEALGTVSKMEPRGGDVRLTVSVGKLDMGDVKLGDRIAVNGVCLTAVEFSTDYFCADVSISEQARAIEIWINAQESLARYLAEKGSITVDGVSLTVNAVNGSEFMLTLIPHTMQETIIQHYKVGTQVNLEVDVIARYVERLILGDKASVKHEKSDISMAMLAENGYLNKR